MVWGETSGWDTTPFTPKTGSGALHAHALGHLMDFTLPGVTLSPTTGQGLSPLLSEVTGVGVAGKVGPRSPCPPSSAGDRPQAIVTLGAAAGGVLGGWLVDRAGRKLSLLFCTAPFVVGFAVITAAQDVWMLLGGRLLTGLACGIASLVAPVSAP